MYIRYVMYLRVIWDLSSWITFIPLTNWSHWLPPIESYFSFCFLFSKINKFDYFDSRMTTTITTATRTATDKRRRSATLAKSSKTWTSTEDRRPSRRVTTFNSPTLRDSSGMEESGTATDLANRTLKKLVWPGSRWASSASTWSVTSGSWSRPSTRPSTETSTTRFRPGQDGWTWSRICPTCSSSSTRQSIFSCTSSCNAPSQLLLLKLFYVKCIKTLTLLHFFLSINFSQMSELLHERVV